jgi:exonuclease III
MLEEFIQRHDIDIALLQEVTDEEKLTCRGYQITANVRTTGRGTAIVHKLNIQFQRIERIPSERGIAAYLNDTSSVNIYAPSGSAKRAEREEFFNSYIMGLLPINPVN